MTLRVLGSDIAVIPIEDPSRTEGGLWIPDSAKQRVDQGIIKYRGPDASELRVGDHVLFSSYSGDHIAHEDEGLLYIMPESAVVAILTSDPPVQMFSLGTIEEVIYARMGEAAAKDEVMDAQDFCDDLISRFRSYTRSTGFQF